MTYPLPSIFIQPSRRADLAAERRDTRGTALFVQLRDELQTALLTDPQAEVSTPGFKASGGMSAADVFFDDFAGTDSDVRRHTLIRLLADAAKGEDVQLRASEFIADLAKRHAEFHHGDALMQEGF